MNNNDKDSLKDVLRAEEAQLVIDDKKVIRKAISSARILMESESFNDRVEGQRLWILARLYQKILTT